MADYNVTFTDPLNGSFIIKPLTTNGPATPASAVPLDPKAVSANTSVVLLGQGMNQYGERVANTLVHMIEHFANATAPAFPVQGQLWFNNSTSTLNIYDGAIWTPILTTTITGDLDMAGFKITNLGTPTVAGDATNKGYVDTLVTNYVLKAGDTMTGFLTLNADPTLPLHAATKQYVDAAVGPSGIYVLKAGDTMTGPLVVNSTITTTGVFTTSNNIQLTSGDVLVDNGTITTNGDIVLVEPTYAITGVVTGPGGTWTFAGNEASRFPVGSRFRVSGNTGFPPVDGVYIVVNSANVGPDTVLTVASIGASATVSGTISTVGIVTIPSMPIDPTDAANKAYVDQEIASVGGGGPALLLVGGLMNPGANITMAGGGEVLGLPATPTTGGSATSKTYVDNVILYTLNPPPQSPSYLRDNAGLAVSVPPALPNTYSVQTVVDALDRGLGVVGGIQFERDPFRSDGVTAQITLPFTYLTESDKLEVYVDGIKAYRAYRGKSYVKMNPTTIYDKFASGGDLTGVPAGIYDFNIAVDGGAPVNVSVTVPASSTFDSLLLLINAAMVTSGVTASAYLLNGTYKFYSFQEDMDPVPFPAFTATVVITPGATDLFAAITGPVAPLSVAERTIVGVYNGAGSDYFEVAADVATILKVGSPFVVVSSTGNDGPYTIAALAYDTSTSRTRIYTVGNIPSAVADGFITMFEFFTSTTNYSEPAPITYGAGVYRYREAGRLHSLGIGGAASASLRYFNATPLDITPNLIVGSKISVGGVNAGIYTIRGFNYGTVIAGRTVIFVDEPIPVDGGVSTSIAVNYFVPALIESNMFAFDLSTIPPANSIIEVRLSR